MRCYPEFVWTKWENKRNTSEYWSAGRLLYLGPPECETREITTRLIRQVTLIGLMVAWGLAFIGPLRYALPMLIFWIVTPCGLTGRFCFGGTYWLQVIMSVPTYKFTRRHNPEDHNQHLKSLLGGCSHAPRRHPLCEMEQLRLYLFRFPFGFQNEITISQVSDIRTASSLILLTFLVSQPHPAALWSQCCLLPVY
jgi:hypothetical protein